LNVPSRLLGTFAAQTRSCNLSILHALNQDPRRFRAHDARVWQDARAKFFAQFPATDRYLLVAFGSALIHQAHPAQLFIKGRETDLDRLNQEFALELVELALG